MPKIVNQKFLPYTIDELYQVIIDVERYPEFIPWFKQIVITSSEGNSIVTDVTIEFMFVRDHYTSTTELIPPHEVDGEMVASVVVTMVEGPFDHFITTWSLKEIAEESCIVDFKCDYSFNNRLYDAISKVALKSMNKKIMDAFIERVVSID
jgi:coenzyme Q-binding protein COQ10